MSRDHSFSGAYAIDAVTPEEAARCRAHIASCRYCRKEVPALQAALARIGASHATTPPSGLKARVMATTDQPQEPDEGYVDPHWSKRARPAWFLPLLIAVVVLLLVTVVVAIAVG